MVPKISILLTTLALSVLAANLTMASVVGTDHDLSTPQTPEVCVFCHTPHAANTEIVVPLWNRVIADKGYTMYSSGSMDTSSAASPNAYSLVCLGCHDGVMGTKQYGGNNLLDKHDLINAPGSGGMPDMTSNPNCRNCHGEFFREPRAFWLGTDLGDDHPVSIPYPTQAMDPDFAVPPNLQRGWWLPTADGVRLFEGKIECPTCHNPHSETYKPFLRVPNSGSSMCLTCHTK